MALIALSLAAPTGALAQQAGGHNAQAAVELKPITIKGTDVQISDLIAPSVLTTHLSSKDINQAQIDSAQDIARLDTSLSYDNKTQSFSLRGLATSRLLTTIDGVKMSWLNDEARNTKGGVTLFDFGALSSFDIIQGTNSSLYGSGASGGVIALHTLEPYDLLGKTKKIGSITRVSFDGVDKSGRVDQAVAIRADQTEFLIQASYARGHEHANNGLSAGENGVNEQENPANFQKISGLIKLYQHLNPYTRLGITLEHYRQDQKTQELNANSHTYKPKSFYNWQSGRRTRLSALYDYAGNDKSLFNLGHAALYWQRQYIAQKNESERLIRPVGDFMRANQTYEDRYGFLGQGLKRAETETTSHILKLILDLSTFNVQQYANGHDNCPTTLEKYDPCRSLHTNQADIPLVLGEDLGFALEDEIGLLDDRLRITLGARYDYYSRVPQNTQTYNQNPEHKADTMPNKAWHLSPKLRTEWDINDNFVVYAQWAQAFRAPTATELYLSYTNAPFYYASGNAQLKPETSNGYELGVRFENEKTKGSISAFYNGYKNFIDFVEGERTRQFLFNRHYINRESVDIWGMEAKTQLSFGYGWHGKGALIYSQGKDQVTKESLNSVQPLKMLAGVGFAKEKWGSDLTITIVGEKELVSKNPDFQNLPAYQLLDFTAWATPLGKEGPRVQFGVYNIFNTRYWQPSNVPTQEPNLHQPGLPKNYYTEAGRSFKISLTQKF
ncbi:TonB-dependent hemoglobin/transferrin/lactoferrin family receptor [Bartonella sp. DGB2]|uniref:TonB-dependent hemoglobin/transferrin/lactoferrin family receptor n=1 Tax=Bartonella sp. DGB2 TaxID=3388426 RepID=UPI00398F9F50